MSSSPPLSLQPVTHADVPHLAQVSAQAFLDDRHTVMKSYGAVKYDMEKISLGHLPAYIDSKKVVFMKACDPETGDIMGTCAWGFRGLDEDEIPQLEGSVKNDNVGDNLWRDKRDGSKYDEENPTVESKEEAKEEVREEEGTKPEEVEDGVKRLNDMTGQNMKEWMTKMMPEGTRCMFVAGLTVDPKFQRRGVGAALLKWGTETADRLGIWIWVHSSQGAKKTYEAAGFKPIGELVIDLDEWAPIPPPPEDDHDGSGKWGLYTITYLSYGKGRWEPTEAIS